MEQMLQPRYFGPHARRLFGVYHPAATAQVRASVLMCPPLLHEHFRSYRFFSQVASELASGGVPCFRFDYFGTGDSEGDDNRFSPAETRQDILLAADELRRSSHGAPLILMGVRGSALFASRDARVVDAAALWLWQPVTDGAAYLETLRARDRSERNSRFRFPLVRGEAKAGPHDLMGFALSDRFDQELSACSISGDAGGAPLTVLAGKDENLQQLPAPLRIDLPDTITAWANQIDLTSLIPVREARPALEKLIAGIPPTGMQQSGISQGSAHG